MRASARRDRAFLCTALLGSAAGRSKTLEPSRMASLAEAMRMASLAEPYDSSCGFAPRHSEGPRGCGSVALSLRCAA
jgi:hypothetical protein